MKGTLFFICLYLLPSNAESLSDGQHLSSKESLNERYIHPDAWDTPFNKITQVACHNCYEPELTIAIDDTLLSLKDTLNYVKAIELDLWDTNSLIPYAYAEPGNWFIRHGIPQDIYLTGSFGNHSNCSGNGSLAYCLGDINEWSEENPNHFPITLFLDKKQFWSSKNEGRTPKDLFKLLDEKLGDKLYRPKEQFDLNDAFKFTPTKWKWPTAASLAGRVIVVVNGGNFLLDRVTRNLSRENATYNTELEKLILKDKTANAFAGPYAFTAKDFSELPNNTSTKAVFLNSDYPSVTTSVIHTLFQNNESRLIRLWNVDRTNFCELLFLRASYLAYYDFKKQQCKGYRIYPMEQPSLNFLHK